MRLARYPFYKDSGVDWLGDVPKHWAVGPLKRRYIVCLGKMLQTDAATDADQLKAYLRAANIQWSGVDVSDVKLMWMSPRDREQLKLRRGDLLTSEGGDVGRSSVWGDELPECYIQNSVNRIRARGSDSTKFLYYWMATIKAKGYVDVLCNKSTIAHFTAEKVAEVPTPFPLPAEQTAIAAFLDRETAKIDVLIAEQEKLIALLAEKRQATISHAVTRGLNPDAPMKDSGVAWLGEVPAHWLTGKIQSFARRESGHTPSRQHPEYWENCTIPWFSLADVWQIREGSIQYVYETKEKVSELGIANSSARVLPAGTVMLSRTASVGYSAIMGCDMATTQDFINWVCGPLLKPEFLLHVLRGMRPEFDRLMMGSTHQTIYMPDVAKLMMTLPPLIEQDAIVAFADDETAELNALTLAAERATALLKERRIALIAAAVTGQIDVRGTMPPPLSPEESTA